MSQNFFNTTGDSIASVGRVDLQEPTLIGACTALVFENAQNVIRGNVCQQQTIFERFERSNVAAVT